MCTRCISSSTVATAFVVLALASAALAGCKDKPAAGNAHDPKTATSGGAETSATQLSSVAARGQKLVATCLACHNAELNPPKAPPLFGISRRYKKATSDKAEFVRKISSFAAKPSKDTALFEHAIAKMGLMPPMALPKDQLEAIAAYFYEATFPPPCAHWKHAIAAAEKAGNSDHARKDKRMYNKLCK